MTDTVKYPNTISADRALSSQEDDKLGMAAMAHVIAKSVEAQIGTPGVIIGLDGAWGSGKSSLVKLVENKLISNDKLIIRRFEPWLIGHRDSMLSEMMGQMASALEEISSYPPRPTNFLQVPQWYLKKLWGRSRKIRNLMILYVNRTAKGVGAASDLATALGMPVPSGLTRSIVACWEWLVGKGTDSLDSIKDEIENTLLQSEKTVVFIVDDIDRLEPKEAIEVLRLLRAVADFPKVIYLICYDFDTLVGCMNAAFNFSDGQRFLEKLVQVSFKLPTPEAFQLRNWLLAECQALYGEVHSKNMNDYTFDSLMLVCQLEGQSLLTPRDVKLVIDSIRFHYPEVKDFVFLPDMTWLHILKLKDRGLYNLIEKYLSEYVAVTGGAKVTSGEKKRFSEQFSTFIEADDHENSSRALWFIQKFLPGFGAADDDNANFRVFEDIDQDHASVAYQNKQIYSPSYSRYYFAYSASSEISRNEDVVDSLAALSRGERPVELFSKLLKQKLPQGRNHGLLLLDRLADQKLETFGQPALRSLQQFIADVMDSAALTEGIGDFGRYPSWGVGWTIYKRALETFNDEEQQKAILEDIRHGTAIGWIMHYIVRRELFSHGIVKDRDSSDDGKLLTPENLALAIPTFIARLESTESDNIINTPLLLDFLFGWLQCGQEYRLGLDEWLANNTSDDDDFLKVMESCRGWMFSDKVYRPLRLKELAHFFDVEQIQSRLQNLRAGENPDQAKKAGELLEAIEIGGRSQWISD